MDYKIIGETVPVVEMKLRAGETVYTQSGGMAYQSDGILMATNARGGIMQSLGRMFTGESIFMANYTAQKDGAMVAFASTVPGGIIDLDLATLPGGMIIQKGEFLCAESNVETSVAFTKKFSAGLFGGEGFILQKVSGQGIAFAEFDGHVVEYELQPGQQIVIDTGHLAAMTASCQMDIQTVPGVKNMLFGGEGFFNTVITGPGRVWLQTMPISNVAGALRPYIPSGS